MLRKEVFNLLSLMVANPETPIHSTQFTVAVVENLDYSDHIKH